LPEPRLRILIPALIAGPDDAHRLAATLAGLPPGLPAVAHPLIQRAGGAEGDAAGGTVAGGDEAERRTPDGPDRCALPVVAHELGAPAGKWAALREGLRRCGPVPFVAVADGDDAYETDVLTTLLWRLEGGEGDLIQGERARIVLDETELGRRRALLEPVVNELLRLRLVSRGTALPAELTDLQSGLFVARRALLERFLAQDRMDGAALGTAPGPLPWGAYGGELHLHAFAAATGARARAHPVRERPGRPSGQTPAGIGAQLAGSVLFAGVGPAELTAALAAAARRAGWSGPEAATALAAAREAFPGAT